MTTPSAGHAALIRYRTVYMVSGPQPGTPATFTDAAEAGAEVNRRLRGAVPVLDVDGVFSGCISWGTDEVPAEPFDGLVDEYASLGGRFGLGDWTLDRGHDFVLIEENVRGGYWLSSHDSAK